MLCHMLRTTCNDSSCFLFSLKNDILNRKCLVVTSSYSKHVTTAGFSLKKSIFLENLSVEIHSFTGPMLCHMLRTICNGGSCFLFSIKYHILHRKRFVVTSSYSDHVTTVPWLFIHPSIYITMTNFSAILKNKN